MDIVAGSFVAIQENQLILPKSVVKQYAACGINKTFDWQAECLSSPEVLSQGRNLVYSAPTSSGKTFVAEIILLKRLLEEKKKAFFVLPFVSVSREKQVYLQKLFRGVGLRVGGFMGGQMPKGGLKMVDVAICTIEKANSLVNRLIEEGELHQLSVMVIDELHMIADNHRGYLLELLLTKLLFYSHRSPPQQHASQLASPLRPCCIQIVGMSATLPNLHLLADWLKAALFVSHYRPVPLCEMIKCGSKVFVAPNLDQPAFEFHGLPDIQSGPLGKDDDDHVMSLCLQTLLTGHSLLLFCPAKARCIQLGHTIAKEIYRLTTNGRETGTGQSLLTALNADGVKDCLEQLRRCPAGMDRDLALMLPYGVAFHHAGLIAEERDVIETAFRRCIVRVLVATTTLSAGVNLPARRVILRTPQFHGGLIDAMTYRQMIGRAGRKGIDTEGESILLCKENEWNKVRQLILEELPPIRSCLIRAGDVTLSLKRAILEVIANGVVESMEEVRAYINSTLLAHSAPGNKLKLSPHSEDTNTSATSAPDFVNLCVSYLEENELVETSLEADDFIKVKATHLGQAVLASSLGPEDGLFVFEEISKVRKSVALDTDLHLVYIVTPVYLHVRENLNWVRYLQLWESLNAADRRVADLCGIDERFITRLSMGRANHNAKQFHHQIVVHRRFYTALLLHDLINERSIVEVSLRFGVDRGMLQGLQQQAATYAGMVTVFCNRLGWTHMENLLSSFQSRLIFGVQAELVDLVRVSLVTAFHARLLFRSGFKTIALLTKARVAEIEKLLDKAIPFVSKKMDTNDRKPTERCFLAPDGTPITNAEAAQLILAEAQQILRDDVKAALGLEWQVASETSPETPSPPMEPMTKSILMESPSAPVEALTKSIQLESSLPTEQSNQFPLEKESAQVDSCQDLFSQSLDLEEIHLTQMNFATSPKSSSFLSSPAIIVHSSPTPRDPPNEVAVDDPLPVAALNDTLTGSWVDAVMQGLDAFSWRKSEASKSRFSEDMFVFSMNGSQLFIPPELDFTEEDIPLEAVIASQDIFVCRDQRSRISTSKDGSIGSLHIQCPSDRPLFTIVQASKNDQLWTQFTTSAKQWWRSCERSHRDPDVVQSDGSNVMSLAFLINNPTESANHSGVMATHQRLSIWLRGLAVSFGGSNNVYFIDFEDIQTGIPRDLLDVFGSPHRPSPISQHGFYLSTLNVKTSLGLLASLCASVDAQHFALSAQGDDTYEPAAALLLDAWSHLWHLFDPVMALWMLSPHSDTVTNQMTLMEMATQLKCMPAKRILDTYPQLTPFSDLPCIVCEASSFGTLSPCDIESTCALAITLRHFCVSGYKNLAAGSRSCVPILWKSMCHLQMPTVLLLTKSELTGFVCDAAHLHSIRDELNKALELIEKAAHLCAGREFNLSIPQEVSQVLFTELRLPPSVHQPTKKSLKRPRVVQHSTAKEVLLGLQSLHPLPRLILEWRRIGLTLSHYFMSLNLGKNVTSRLQGTYDCLTATGRISMHDPNLQSVPRDFIIDWPTILDSRVLVKHAQLKKHPAFRPASQTLQFRRAFGVADHCELVALDYAQLELRILAHLSADSNLLRLFATQEDAFKMIAMHWLGYASKEDVSPAERQHCKQLCYGIIYGMTSSTLAKELEVTEEKANAFISTFQRAYPELFEYVSDVVQDCRAQGFVSTITGRRRYLKEINNSTSSYSRARAERQAVNTSIQGSASDLVKQAMLNVDQEVQKLRENRTNAGHHQPICRLLLHLHDELIYEVCSCCANDVIAVVKQCMESVEGISIPLPVKVTRGRDWSFQ